MYDKEVMSGAIGVIDRAGGQNFFLTRIRMPAGKLANLLSLMKMVNCMRTDNFNVSNEALETVKGLMVDIKRIIENDNTMAAAALEELGANQNPATAKRPNLDFDCCPHAIFASGDSDVTLKQCDIGSLRKYFDIHGAIKAQ